MLIAKKKDIGQGNARRRKEGPLRYWPQKKMIRGDGVWTPSPAPRVTLTVEGTPMDFLVDTGAEYSVQKQPLGKLKNTKTIIIGATGQKQYPWTTLRTVDLGRGQIPSWLSLSVPHLY